MNLQTIKMNFNRGRMNLNEIQWLIDTAEQLEEENGNMAEKHAEKDMSIKGMMKIIEEQKETIRELKHKNRVHKYLELEQNNFEFAQENSELAKKLHAANQEIERLLVVKEAYEAYKKAY